jgi:hypothetical protein
MTDHWAESGAGLRGSAFLKLGAAVYLITAGLNLIGKLILPGGADPGNPLFLGAMLVWGLTLFLLGTGFIWTGFQPVMGRLGIAVGLFFYLQGLFLMIALIAPAAMPFPPSILSVGRTFLLAIYAVAERGRLGRSAALPLGIISSVQFVRVFLRNLDVWPLMDHTIEAALTAIFMTVTAWAVFAVGKSVHRLEDEWGLANSHPQRSRLAEFNNPQHNWNRTP